MSQVCPRCGVQALDSLASCERCGAAFTAQAPSTSGSTWGALEVMRNGPAGGLASAPRVARSVGAQPGVARPRTASQGASPSRGAQPPGHSAAASGAGAAAAAQRRPPAAVDNDDPLGVFETGMLDLGGDAADGQASALSLDTVSMPPPEAAPEPVAAVVEETRGQKVDELAGFGARPRRHFETVPYFVRVLLRKRALELELQGLTAHRKRLDTQTEEALCALGEALYGLHTDARLKPLAQQLRVVAETKKQVGVKEAASLQANDEHGRELQKLQQDVRKVEADAVPLRNREADMQARADKLKAHIKRKEAAARKAEEDIKALRASPDVTAIERIRALEAERDAHVGEVQSRNVQLLPVHEDLGALRREIAKLMETLTALHAEERKYTQAMDREQERHRVSTGGARNALKDVLRALAAAAQQAKLAALAPALATAATDAEARAKTKRNVEETFRAAVQSYDHEAYTRGMYILVGGTIGIFVLFAGMIIF